MKKVIAVATGSNLKGYEDGQQSMKANYPSPETNSVMWCKYKTFGYGEYGCKFDHYWTLYPGKDLPKEIHEYPERYPFESAGYYNKPSETEIIEALIDLVDKLPDWELCISKKDGYYRGFEPIQYGKRKRTAYFNMESITD